MLYKEEDILKNKTLFIDWYKTHTASKNELYKNHAIDVLDFWLDEKLPGKDIGCLFRFDNINEFTDKLNYIYSLDEYTTIDDLDQHGRPQAVLNYYKQYLDENIYRNYLTNRI